MRESKSGQTIRKVTISDVVQNKIDELERYLHNEFCFSKPAALRRSRQIREFIYNLSNPGDYAPCRYRKWCKLGYHCAAFEGWVFAYEIFDEGVIIRDMSHGKLLDDTATSSTRQ